MTASRLPGVGYELKRHQFDWAKSNGLSAITWTFDPLVRRNCVFNLTKLGAIAYEFLPNFYGMMTDDINAGDVSDRLFAYWPLIQKTNSAKIQITENIALINKDGIPHRNIFDSKQPFAIYLPEDIELLRKSNLDLVKLWRNHLHELLSAAFNSGAKITEMVDNRNALLVTPLEKSKGIT